MTSPNIMDISKFEKILQNFSNIPKFQGLSKILGDFLKFPETLNYQESSQNFREFRKFHTNPATGAEVRRISLNCNEVFET